MNASSLGNLRDDALQLSRAPPPKTCSSECKFAQILPHSQSSIPEFLLSCRWFAHKISPPQILHRADFRDRIAATPALVEKQIYVRTSTSLYAFGT
jgi:hypothetical protein